MRKMWIGVMVILTVLISLFVQVNLLDVIPLFGVSANMGIVIVAGIGLMSGRMIGGLTGGLYGSMLDVIFSKAIGTHIALYVLIGLFTGRISKHFSKENRTTFVMIVILTTALFEMIQWGLNSIVFETKITFWQAWAVVALETLYNLMITIMLYRFLVGFGELINKSKNSYYLL